MAKNLIEGFILDVEDPSRGISFYSFEPPGNSVEPNYEYQTVRGRSAPYRYYADTSPDTWSFSIQLRASVEGGDPRTHEDVWSDHLVLKSFAYPEYSESTTRPPRLANLRWGNVIDLVGVIKSPSFQWVLPYDANGYPFGIDVSFTFEVDPQGNPFSFQDIENGRGV